MNEDVNYFVKIYIVCIYVINFNLFIIKYDEFE